MAGPASVPQMTPQTFATSLLRGLGDPTTPQNVQGIVGWEAREGGAWHNSANANPLNTTENAPGATAMNGVGVKSYLNWNQGLNATESTLRNGHYGDILGALRSGRGLTGNLQGLKTWSGGGYSSITPTGAYNPPPTSYGVPRANGAGNHANGGTIAPQASPAAPTSNFAEAIAGAFQHAGNASEGALAQQLQTALAHRTQIPHVEPGTTQRIPDQVVGQIATMGDTPHTLALAGALAISHDPRLGAFNRLVTSADNVTRSHYNYEWGGGHDPSFQPGSGVGHGSGPGVGYDCSGVLSHVLHMAGILNQPLVSGQFAELNRYVPQAQPGVGHGPHTITIYANPEHVYANIGGTYFGTSSQNQGGGAGWIGATSENNNADYTAWHINF